MPRTARTSRLFHCFLDLSGETIAYTILSSYTLIFQQSLVVAMHVDWRLAGTGLGVPMLLL
jgi:hypothetical protein